MQIRLLFFLFLFCFNQLSAKQQQWEPDFLIVGAQKSGTTVLSSLLRQHPLILKSRGGEVHFFDNNFYRGVEWYKTKFLPRPDQNYLLFDKSPYYLFHPLAPERAHSLYPNLKIIIILRNPVDRAYSQYWHNKRRENREPLSFEEAIAAEPERIQGEEEKMIANPRYFSHAHMHCSYLSRGVYITQVQRWLDYFPKEQVMIISSTDLHTNTDRVINKLFNFLGVPEFHDLKVRKSKSNYDPMNPKLRQKLIDYFRPHNEELEAFLGREFNWH